MMKIPRRRLFQEVVRALAGSPVVALMGPRQCGKTTLARDVVRQRRAHYFDLEDARDAAALGNPQLALEGLKGLVVIDEAQLKPELFRALRVLVDRRPLPARFLLLGSASFDLSKGCAESLAGRIHFVDMAGFDLQEVGVAHWHNLWLRGGFPRSFLGRSENESLQWRQQFIRTFLQRDLPQLGISIPAEQMRRFWTMLAHSHGGAWNSSAFASSLGVTHTTTRRWLDILSGALMIRQLPPWFDNAGKRVVKAPKIYLRDSGLLHALLDIGNHGQLRSHPRLGASWEGFVLEQTLRLTGQEGNAYFWGTYSGAELDLLLLQGGRRLGIEIKYADAPQMTKSMHVAMHDLQLRQLFVIYPGPKRYRLTERVEVVPLAELTKLF
jgi:predicted AAA+ superfamily ATPase